MDRRPAHAADAHRVRRGRGGLGGVRPAGLGRHASRASRAPTASSSASPSACPPTTSRPGRRSGRSPSRCTGPGSSPKGCSSIATGGPGSSGIAEADDRLAGMRYTITDYYDIVFFDQRGHRAVRALPLRRGVLVRRRGGRPLLDGRGAELLRPGHRAVRGGVLRRGRGGPGGRRPVQHPAGGRGPRGLPRLARRRPADPLRRELRHPVPADLRGGAPRARARRWCWTASSTCAPTCSTSGSSRPRPTATCWRRS